MSTRTRHAVTVAAALREAESALAARGISPARLDAEVLLAHCLGISRGDLIRRIAGESEASLDAGVETAYRDLIRRRLRHEPVAYLVGHKEFWSLDLIVGPAVLIPRPETEHVVAWALKLLPPPVGRPLLAVDVGTGSGAIAVALAREREDLRVVGVDVSAAALEIARRNACRHATADRIRLVQGDLLAPFVGGHAARRVGAVVSNPPYLRRTERADLMVDVREFEPDEALFDEGGAGVFPRLVGQAADLLAPGGWLVIEISPQRAGEALDVLRAPGCWEDLGVEPDYAGLPRVVRARRGSGGP